MNVFCLIAVRNEERYLPGFLHHMRHAVDGIIALDDCSTDRTLEILRSEPCVVSILAEDRAGLPHANETSNRHRLLVEAARLGAQWVVCADADERFEARFLDRLHAEAEEGERQAGSSDACASSISGTRHSISGSTAAMGRAGRRACSSCQPSFRRVLRSCTDPGFPSSWDNAPKANANAYLFHLSMMHKADRQARFEKFRLIDPQNVHQTIGYRHLIDETNLTLRPVPPWRSYFDLASSDLPINRSAASFRTLPFRRDVHVCQHPDVQSAVAQGHFASGWEHFTRYGLGEGRLWRPRARSSGIDFDAIFRQRRMGSR